jgi:hypothetical protein
MRKPGKNVPVLVPMAIEKENKFGRIGKAAPGSGYWG